ncbi:MAG: ComEC/Rec2 family competence protein [Opitutales bacterium]|nr:ComEC/Rec2 family competence protein [Opitutales bacterium]
MRNPILIILIPYIIFILFCENQVFIINIIIKFLILHIFIKLIIFDYLFSRIKTSLLITFEIILLLNLINYYDYKINPNLEINPKREVTLKLDIKRKVNNLQSNYYIAEIITAPTLNENLANQIILCRLENNQVSTLIKQDYHVKGILETRLINNDYYITFSRCEILDVNKRKSKNIIVQLGLLIEEKILESIKNKDELNSFINAIILGNKKMLTSSQKSTFQKSGTLHLFAVSGLHIGFVYLIFKFLITIITFNRYITELIIALILVIYLDLVNYPPSAIRACLMINIWQLSIIFFKRKNTLSSLCLSCLIILIVNPSALMEVGFQLSYTVVTSIIVFNTQIQKAKESFKINIGSFIHNSVLVSYSAFCGSMLLVYDYFNIFVPGSIIINILAIPIAFIFIISIFLMLLLSILIKIDFFFYFFSLLYNILDYLLSIFTISGLTYFKINVLPDLDNSVHFFYLISILFLYKLCKEKGIKLLFLLFIPISFFLLYTLIGI